MVSRPTYEIESEFAERHSFIAGVDEAGRGPWAGPVVAAAVILDPACIPDGLNDSKKLSEAKRNRLFEIITQCADVGVGIADVAEIDELNILRATFLAMDRAVNELTEPPGLALIDGSQRPPLACACETVIKGDGKSVSIAAASIIAKVTRDRMMEELDAQMPQYHWRQNKGYGTKQHRDALEGNGVSRHHRRSFKPIAELVSAGKLLASQPLTV